MARRQRPCSPVLTACFFFALPALLWGLSEGRLIHLLEFLAPSSPGAFTFPEPFKPEGQEVPGCCKPEAGVWREGSKGWKPWAAGRLPEMANVYRKGERLSS